MLHYCLPLTKAFELALGLRLNPTIFLNKVMDNSYSLSTQILDKFEKNFVICCFTKQSKCINNLKWKKFNDLIQCSRK